MLTVHLPTPDYRCFPRCVHPTPCAQLLGAVCRFVRVVCHSCSDLCSVLAIFNISPDNLSLQSQASENMEKTVSHPSIADKIFCALEENVDLYNSINTVLAAERQTKNYWCERGEHHVPSSLTVSCLKA